MKVLIPVDGSESNENAIEWAIRSLRKDLVEISLLHVTLIGFSEYPVYELDFDQGEALLERIKFQLKKEGFNVSKTAAVKTYESLAAEICAYADEWQADQILMGSHGRGSLMNLVMGSVSESVFKHARQPVLILSSHGGQTALKASHMDHDLSVM